MHPRTLAEDDCLGMKEEMPVAVEEETEQFLQMYLLVQGNQEKLLPVSIRRGMDCGGVPKLREIE